MELAAILVSPTGAAGVLRDVMERLAGVGVTVTIVDELAVAVEVSQRHAETERSSEHRAKPAILLDLLEVGAGEVEDQKAAADMLRRTLARLPNALPIVVTRAADPRLIVACIRAGAGDVIDLQLEGMAAARAIVQRICERQAARAAELAMIAAQRGMIEDLLKELIRTERRSIDAETALAARERTSNEIASALDSRSPAVLLVEPERAIADELAELLEAAGVSTFAYLTGEDALREADPLASSIGLDLALISAQLPGIDGLETIRRLRAHIPGIPAFLMTSVHDGDLAVHAANLGVVGFVYKPLAELHDVVVRLAQLARDSLHRTRERVYLQRIKERHERVLARYRTLPREP